MTIEWNDNLKTGILIIDQQHQSLFEIINKLNRFKESKKGFYELLLELQNYASTHFKTEEEYMHYMNYPDLNHHKECHEKFVQDFRTLLKKISTVDNITELGPEFINFVENWIKQHYTEEDVKMASFINTNRLKIN